MRPRKLSLAQEKSVDDLLLEGGRIAPENRALPLPELIGLLRRRLRMTQRILAKRAGMAQSYIGKVESGSVSPSLHTIDRIFEALGCRLALIPIPKAMPDEVIEAQALKTAEQMVDYVAGTMALEGLCLEDEMKERLIAKEKQRLLVGASSNIW